MVSGTGHYLPERILTNADWEKMVDTSDEWIITRTGIRERHVAAPEEATSDLSTKAALSALENAGLAPEDVELIIVGTVNPDMKFPSASVFVQHNIGSARAAAFDVGGACCGFLYSLTIADALIGTGVYKNAVVIGTEILTRMIDWTDRNTCVLFGDGSGAVVLEKSDGERGLLSSTLQSDGSLTHLLYYAAEGTRYGASHETLDKGLHAMMMNGREVFKHAVRQMADSSIKAVEMAGLKPEDIDLLIPHQANIRIIDATAKRLGFGDDRVVVNIDKTGNTSSASIPIAMDQAHRAGRLQKGMNVLMTVFGGGLTWGAAVLKF
ncbi:MAG: ketoacyl-ACP synthase III [FCB group bacterium]|nr:ketoacyl-ACP synthase III [FCB group bacterium]